MALVLHVRHAGLLLKVLRVLRVARLVLRERAEVLMNEIPERPPQEQADQFLFPVVKQDLSHDFLHGAEAVTGAF